MTDYIKREDAIAVINNYIGDDSPYAQWFVRKIRQLDAVPVVRCEECRFSEVFQNDSSGVMARYCNAFRLVRMVADNDYCSYGERRDDEIDKR